MKKGPPFGFAECVGCLHQAEGRLLDRGLDRFDDQRQTGDERCNHHAPSGEYDPNAKKLVEQLADGTALAEHEEQKKTQGDWGKNHRQYDQQIDR